MRSAYTFRNSSKEERIVVTEYKRPGALVCSILHITATEIRQREKTGHVRIIHQQRVAKAVNLIRINPAMRGMVHDRIFFKRAMQVVSHAPCIVRQLLVPQNFG